MAKWVVNLTWEDAPHLTKEQKEELLAGYSPHERDARSKGLPQLGSGAIYPIVEADVLCEPFKIPDAWPRACAMDVGWKKTAAIWGAYDAKSDTWYLYSEYYMGYKEPSVHADAIKARGTWVPIVVDCHANRRSEAGQEALLTTYTHFGLNIGPASNGPGTKEPGILDCFQKLSSGRIKVFSYLQNWRNEFRLYRRDDNGKIVDNDDHLMDCTRFLSTDGTKVMEVPPPEDYEDSDEYQQYSPNKQGKSGVTGY